MVLDGQQVAVFEERRSRLGRSARRRRLCRACRLDPLGDRYKRADTHRSPASAPELAIRRGFGRGNRFSRRSLRSVIMLGAMGPRVLSEAGAVQRASGGRPSTAAPPTLTEMQFLSRSASGRLRGGALDLEKPTISCQISGDIVPCFRKSHHALLALGVGL